MLSAGIEPVRMILHHTIETDIDPLEKETRLGISQEQSKIFLCPQRELTILYTKIVYLEGTES